MKPGETEKSIIPNHTFFNLGKAFKNFKNRLKHETALQDTPKYKRLVLILQQRS